MTICKYVEGRARVEWNPSKWDGSRCDETKKKLNFHEPNEKNHKIKCYLNGDERKVGMRGANKERTLKVDDLEKLRV